jgi:hypothetical protein
MGMKLITHVHFRNKTREYLKEKMYELAMNSNNKNIREMNLRGTTSLEIT